LSFAYLGQLDGRRAGWLVVERAGGRLCQLEEVLPCPRIDMAAVSGERRMPQHENNVIIEVAAWSGLAPLPTERLGAVATATKFD